MQVSDSDEPMFKMNLDEDGNNGPFHTSEAAITAGMCDFGHVYYMGHEWGEGWNWAEFEFICDDGSGGWVIRWENRDADATPTETTGVWKVIDKPFRWSTDLDKGIYSNLEGSGTYCDGCGVGLYFILFNGELTIP